MIITFDIALLVLIFGVLIGIISSLSGTGGGTMYVPLIALLLLNPINIAVGTSTFIIMISSGAGFFTHLKNKRINLKLTFTFASFSLMGSILCTILFQVLFPINNEVLRIFFATVLLVVAILMLNKARIEYKTSKDETNTIEKDKEFHEFNYKKELGKGIPLFLLGGFLVNLLGIGGGIVNVPSLHLLLGFSIHDSAVLSTSIIFFTSLYNSIFKLFLGVVDILLGVFIALGSVIGAIIGARYLKKIPKSILQFFIAFILMTLSIVMFLK